MSGALTPIETVYNGYRFRSRLEARWAVFFDELGIRYEYEPEGIVLSDGRGYLPDFYLPDFHCFFEVKRDGIQGTSEGYEAISKISNGADNNEWAGIIAFGDPEDDNLEIFCQESDEGGGGNYAGSVTIGIHPKTGKPYLFAGGDRRERAFFDSFGEDMKMIPMVTEEYGAYAYKDFVNSRVLHARKAARQARFEHGESPETAPVTIPEPTMQPVQVWRPSLPIQHVKTAHRTAMVSGNDTDKYKAAMHVFSHMCLTGAVLMKKGRFVGADSTTVYVEFDEWARTIAETVSLPNMMNPMEDALSEAFGRPMRCQITVVQEAEPANSISPEVWRELCETFGE